MGSDGEATPMANVDETYNDLDREMKSRLSKEEYDAYTAIVEEEKEQVKNIILEEGGELNDVIARVRAQTIAVRDIVHNEYMKQHNQNIKPMAEEKSQKTTPTNED